MSDGQLQQQQPQCLEAFFTNGVMLNGVIDTIVEIRHHVSIFFTKDGMEIACKSNATCGCGINMVIPRWYFSSYYIYPPDSLYHFGIDLTILQKLLHHCTHNDVVSFVMYKEDLSTWWLNRDDISTSSYVSYKLTNLDMDTQLARSFQHTIPYHIRINSTKLKSVMQEFLKHNPKYVKVMMNKVLVQFNVDASVYNLEGNIIIYNQLNQLPQQRSGVTASSKKQTQKKRKVSKVSDGAVDDPMMALSNTCTMEEESKCQIEDAGDDETPEVKKKAQLMKWKKETHVMNIVNQKAKIRNELANLKKDENFRFVRFLKTYIKPIIKMCSLSTNVDIYITDEGFIVFKVVLSNDIQESMNAMAELSRDKTSSVGSNEINTPMMQLVFQHVIDVDDDDDDDDDTEAVENENDLSNSVCRIKLEDAMNADLEGYL